MCHSFDCVVLNCWLTYFIMMGVQNVYATYVEKNIFMVAREKDRASVVSLVKRRTAHFWGKYV